MTSKILQRKKLIESLQTSALNALDKVNNKFDVRTVASYRKKIYDSNRVDTLEKFIKSFNEINIKKHDDIPITIKQIKQDKKENNEKVRAKEAEFKSNKKLLISQLREKTLIQKIRTEEKEKRKTHKSAISGLYRQSTVDADDIDTISGFNNNNKNELYQILYNMIKRDFSNMTSDRKYKCTMRAYVVIDTMMKRITISTDGTETEENESRPFNSRAADVVSLNNISEITHDIVNQYLNHLESAKRGSNWLFKHFEQFKVASTVIKSALGKSYIELPKVIKNKNAVVNIKNTDDRCFDYCLVASKIYDSIKGKDKNDPRYYKKNSNKIKIPENIIYPITSNDIHLYEELNEIQINVFSLDGYTEDVEDVRTCINEEYKSNKHRRDVVNMLLIRDGDKSHYTYISNLSRLFSSKTSHHSKFHCPHCIVKCYKNVELLNKHIEKCLNYDEVDKVNIDVVCECPIEGNNIMKFKNNGNKSNHPFSVVADFESTLEKVDNSTYNMLSKEEQKKIKTI